MLQIKLQSSGNCHGGSHSTQSAGGLEAAGTMGRLQRAAQTNTGLITDDDTADQIVHGQIVPLARCHQSRDGGSCQMDGAETMAVIQLQHMAEHAVHHGGILERGLAAAHTHKGRALGDGRLQIQILSQLGLQHGAAAQDGAKEVQQAQPRFTDDLFGKFAVCQFIDRTGKNISQILFHSDSLSSFTALRKPCGARSSSRDAWPPRARRWRAEDRPS